MKNILAFTGSTNPDSINEKLLKVSLNVLPSANAKIVQLDSDSIPIYSQKVEGESGIPTPIKELYKSIIDADAFVIASPEHNGLPSSFLKNIIDWLSRIDQKIFGDKPVLLLSTSPGANGGASHLKILEDLLPRWGAINSKTYSLGNFFENYNEETQTLTNTTELNKLQGLVGDLIAVR